MTKKKKKKNDDCCIRCDRCGVHISTNHSHLWESWYVRLVFHIVQPQPQPLHRSLAIIDTFDHSCRRNLTHFVFVRFYETQSGTNCRSKQPTYQKNKTKQKKAEKKSWWPVCSSLFIINCLFNFDKLILMNIQ